VKIRCVSSHCGNSVIDTGQLLQNFRKKSLNTDKNLFIKILFFVNKTVRHNDVIVKLVLTAQVTLIKLNMFFSSEIYS